MSNKLLTIGMATHDDYHGVFFTIQALRLYHPICNGDLVEFLVIDNNPESKHGKETKKFVNSIRGRYVPYTEKKSSFVKYEIPKLATGKYVLQMDCHVMLYPESLNRLLKYFAENDNCRDLIQGPMGHDDLNNVNTHWEPKFRGHMYGIWAHDKKSYERGEPFEIPMLGMGLFAYERKNFPKISKYFIGFGAEEGVIHEYFRNGGGRVMCIPQLKWIHRFGRPEGVNFPLTLDDRVYNYFLGYYDIYRNENHQMINEIYNYFRDKLGSKTQIDVLKNKAINKIKHNG